MTTTTTTTGYTVPTLPPATPERLHIRAGPETIRTVSRSTAARARSASARSAIQRANRPGLDIIYRDMRAQPKYSTMERFNTENDRIFTIPFSLTLTGTTNSEIELCLPTVVNQDGTVVACELIKLAVTSLMPQDGGHYYSLYVKDDIAGNNGLTNKRLDKKNVLIFEHRGTYVGAAGQSVYEDTKESYIGTQNKGIVVTSNVIFAADSTIADQTYTGKLYYKQVMLSTPAYVCYKNSERT